MTKGRFKKRFQIMVILELVDIKNPAIAGLVLRLPLLLFASLPRHEYAE